MSLHFGYPSLINHTLTQFVKVTSFQNSTCCLQTSMSFLMIWVFFSIFPEDDPALDERIAQIRSKNDAINARQEQIEADKKLYG